MLTASCQTCNQPYEVRRHDHKFCSARCRLRGFAGQQLVELRRIMEWVQKEIARWEKITKD